MTLRVAANVSLLYPHLPLRDRLPAAAADGFDAVELLFPYDIDPAELAGALGAAGLTHVLVNTPLGPHGQRGFAGVPGAEVPFREAFGRALALAGTTGCGIVHVMAGDRPAGASYDACVATLVANLAWAAPQAADAGVVLTLEALNHLDMPGYLYARPAQVRAVVEQVAHPAVRVQFDLFHTAREELPLAAELAAALPFVGHVQLAGTPDRHEPDLAAPGLTEALTLLDERGYDGWVGFEYVPRSDTAVGLAWCAPLRARGLFPPHDRAGDTRVVDGGSTGVAAAG